jgi:hypothetical protein
MPSNARASARRNELLPEPLSPMTTCHPAKLPASTAQSSSRIERTFRSDALAMYMTLYRSAIAPRAGRTSERGA